LLTWLLGELVRLAQHQHGSEDIRVVFYRKAATVLQMKDDKDDSNDNQNGGGVYSTMTCSEKRQEGLYFSVPQVTLHMRSVA